MFGVEKTWVCLFFFKDLLTSEREWWGEEQKEREREPHADSPLGAECVRAQSHNLDHKLSWNQEVNT